MKPWNLETIQEKLGYCRESGCFAVAMDIDAAGLPFLKNMNPPAGSKTVEELRRDRRNAPEVPFIVKGIMTVAGAAESQRGRRGRHRGHPTTAAAFWISAPLLPKFWRTSRTP